MLKRLLTILIILTAFTILGVTLYGQYRDTKTKTTNENMDERVGVVEGEKGQEREEATIQRTIPERRSSVVEAYIQEVFGVDFDFGLNIANCESGLRVDAVSPSGKYIGLYQFDNNTFYSNCVGDIGNWKDQVVCAKKLYDKGETWRWPNCP